MKNAVKDAASTSPRRLHQRALPSPPLGDWPRPSREALSQRPRPSAVNSTKSMTGHLLGAAGGVEAVFSILALRDQVSPPTINLRNADPQCDLDYVANEARKMPIRIALSNSFGFGGTNGTLIFARL